MFSKTLGVIRTLAIALTGLLMLWVTYRSFDTMGARPLAFCTVMALVVLGAAIYSAKQTYQEFKE